MNTRLVVGPIIAVGLLLAGCPQAGAVVPKSSGSIGLSPDDRILYVADADHATVTLIDTETKRVVGQTQVAAGPERVLVTPSGEVFVSSRAARTVSRLSKDGLHVELTATVGAEPVGLALSNDGKSLFVANSMSGTLSVLDVATLAQRAELKVGGQPWAVAPLADNNRVYVTDYLDGTVRVVDVTLGAVISTLTLEQPPEAECQWGDLPARTPAQAADVILSPDGERAYVAHVQSRVGTEMFQTSLAFAVAPALSTVNTANNTPYRETRRDPLTTTPTRQEFPASLLATNMDESCRNSGRSTGMDAPSSLVVDGMGEWVFVADHNSNAVAVVSSVRRNDARFRVPDRGIADVVRVGARPTGIAVAGDLKHAYVHNALDYTVSFVENVDGQLLATTAVPFATSGLPADVERGRRLFYSAVDERLTQPELGGVSCSSCHPHGRTDGLSWVLPQAPRQWNQPIVPPARRNTPALWGVTGTAPYHWDGTFATMPAFSTHMVSQMGGLGLDNRDVGDLTAYMTTIELPDNPTLGLAAPGLVARGKELFTSSCAGCHAGSKLTDGQTHPVYFGTVAKLDTPSLRGVFATRPYLHDGSAGSLNAVLRSSRPTIREHDQRALSPADAEALEAYVSSL